MQDVNEYDRIPVYYCRNCCSLKILRIDSDSNGCYCGNCNSTNIGYTDIHRYLRKVREYNSIFNKNNNIESIGDLKNGCKTKRR